MGILILSSGNVQAGTTEDIALLKADVAAMKITLTEQQNAIAQLLSELDNNDAVKMGKLGYVKIETNEINALKGPHVIFEGVNVHVRDGSGQTRGNNNGEEGYVMTGLGNIVVGYNELPVNPFYLTGEEFSPADRLGFHNLIMGEQNRNKGYGSIIQGYNCIVGSNSAGISCDTSMINESWSVIISGNNNAINNYGSVIVGGQENKINSEYAVGVAGYSNIINGPRASTVGGSYNQANGENGSITGGNSIILENIDGWSAPGH